jgi:membrane protein YqaA with SNARE-associated domain
MKAERADFHPPFFIRLGYSSIMFDFAAYAGLFSAAFIAATIFPMQSEAILVGLILADRYSLVGLLLVASVGNTAGAAVNWLLGRGVERFRDSRWFPVSEDKLDKAQAWYQKIRKMVAAAELAADRR